MEMAHHHLLLGRNGLKLNHRHVAALGEGSGLVENVGDAAGHAGGEIAPGLANDDDNAAGHVFAAMVAHSLDHSDRAGVAHAETLARDAAEIALSGDSAVEHRVADDDRLLGLDLCGFPRRVDDNAPARHALADIVVGVALEFERHAPGEERAEALAGGALQLDMDRLVAEPRMTVALGDLARQHGAGRAIAVADRKVEPNVSAALERLFRLGDQATVEHVLEHVVLGDAAVNRVARPWRRLVEQAREVEALRLRMLDELGPVEHLPLADHFVKLAVAERRHQLAHLLCDEEEVVDDMLRLAYEALAQHRILGCDADRAGVEVALAHEDASGCDQRRGGEAELVGAQEGADDDVATGAQP